MKSTLIIQPGFFAGPGIKTTPAPAPAPVTEPDPEEPLTGDDIPDDATEEDPYENPQPYENPEPGEGP